MDSTWGNCKARSGKLGLAFINLLAKRTDRIMNSTVELCLPLEWENDNGMMDEELSATSSEEASKVFEQWKTQDEEKDMDIMDVDEQIGSELLDIFQDPCMSPTGPLDELNYMNLGEADVDRFSLSLLNDVDDGAVDTTSSLPFEERYKATLKKLAESMKRSQVTRQSLSIKTAKTEEYLRNNASVPGVLSSIEKSTQQLQGYLKNMQRL